MKEPRHSSGLRAAAIAALFLLLSSLIAFGQATTSTGSIQGSVTDPTGAVVPDAKVTITNSATGQQIVRQTTSTGTYNSGPLSSGAYRIRIEAKGFQSAETNATVQVGVSSSGSVKLSIGSSGQTIEVTTEAVQVNTEQPTVQGVLNSEQIENLPVNGRNFLDLAQLEPGVQIQDGGNFDPTKNGFSSISFGGRAGRTARISVDGIDISDETVGTTTQNVSAGAISEFQLSQSTLDLSTELTSSGAVNVVTKSGGNKTHGEGFYNLRDKRAGFANFPDGQDNYFQRNQFGGSLGGAIVKNKLFWFVNGERVKQSTLIPISTAGSVFSGAIPGSYNSPFKDTTLLAKADYDGPRNMHFFYRFNYNWNSDVAAYGSTFQPFANRDNTPSHGIGWDWAPGRFTHSIRYGHQKFQNHITDAVLGSGTYSPAGDAPVAIRIGGPDTQFRFGPSRLAPQATFQGNDQIKYDGAYTVGSHIIRYGADFNRIQGGGFASFYFWPEMRAKGTDATSVAFAQAGPYPGGAQNPLNYKMSQISLGNGQGFSTETPNFGYPAGGQHDNRIGLYLGDTWKIKPNLTITAGVRYSRDTGRADSDLAAITCDQIPQSTLDALTPAQIPCSGSQRLLDQFGGKFGGPVNQPNMNFGPQVGFAWDPWKTGKTSIRGGIGLFYENAVFNNVLFDRPVRLPQGLFWVQALPCPGGQLTLPSGTVTTFPYQGSNVSIASLCGQRIGDVVNQVAALSDYYHSQTAAGGAQANAAFVGAGLTSGTAASLIAPNYKTPESIQMNLGIQREIHPGTVLSVDFLRNVGLHYLLGVDTNHVGDVRYFNKSAAQAAIAATLSQFEVSSIDEAIAAGATMEDFALNGLGSGSDIGGGLPAPLAATPDNPLTGGYAFGGINPLVGTNPMLFPNGRSVYTALQVKLTHRSTNPLPGVAQMNLQAAYSWSRFNTMTGDQDFINNALDYASPGRYFGPGSLDRTHQVSFGTIFQVKRGPQLSFIGHFMSPLAITPTLVAGGNAGEIFYTDLTGDGTNGDVIPGANIGSYGRDFNGSNINNLISSFNSKYAGGLTPAGQVLVSSGLFTPAQMAALGATISALPSAPSDQAPLTWLRSFDLKLAYPIKIREGVQLMPSVAFYNVFNFANFNTSTAPGSILVGLADGSSGSINGTPNGAAPRAGLGTGVNAIGSPRQTEFGIRLTF